MRVFLVSCVAATMIVLIAAAGLLEFVQESSSAAFTESSVRID